MSIMEQPVANTAPELNDADSPNNKRAKKEEMNMCELFRTIFFHNCVQHAVFVRSMDPAEGLIERAVKVLRELNLPNFLLVELDGEMVNCRKTLMETFFDSETGEFNSKHGIEMVVFTDPISCMEEIPEPFHEAEPIHRNIIVLHYTDDNELKEQMCGDLDPEFQVHVMRHPYHIRGEPTEEDFRKFFQEDFFI